MVIYGTQQKIKFNDLLLTIGNFDGVHRGHKKILERMIIEKNSHGGSIAAYTFDPHPQAFFKKEIEHLLTPLDEKIQLLERAGVDIIIVEKFTQILADMDTQTFFNNIIVEKIHPKKIYTGTNFRFGKNREGDVKVLEALTRLSHIDYEPIGPLYNNDGNRVSSSAIRKFLEQGKVLEAADYLGRAYSIHGLVVTGKAVGRKIHVPTANINGDSFIIPKDGVYAVTIEYEGKKYNGVANIMIRDQKPLLEVHFFNFSQTIYDKKIRVHFIERIRDEMIFQNQDALKSQILQDILQARKILKIND